MALSKPPVAEERMKRRARPTRLIYIEISSSGLT